MPTTPTPLPKVRKTPIKDLIPHPDNPRRGDIDAIADSLTAHGQYRPIVANTRTGHVLAGNHTLAAAIQLGWTHVQVAWVDVDDDTETRILLADNRTADLGTYDPDALVALLDSLDTTDLGLDGTGYTPGDLLALLADQNPQPAPPTTPLAERFGWTPMTVLDARSGPWGERKRAWLQIGIESEKGRDGSLTIDSASGYFPDYYRKKTKAEALLGRPLTHAEFETDYLPKPDSGISGTGTSVFDPVLTEISYLWHTNPGDHILDPFAGGSVRGIVAAILDRRYTGIDLSADQIVANRTQAETLLTPNQPAPTWHIGDSKTTIPTLADTYDYVFTCPPYADLEVYSDDQADISNMPYPDFLDIYRTIITEAAERLEPDRFATIVVGEARNKRTGHYHGLVPDTIRAFTDAGLHFHNEAILVTPTGSVPSRIARPFGATRRLGKTHQNVLTFVKGDPRKAAARLQPVDIPTLPDTPETP